MLHNRLKSRLLLIHALTLATLCANGCASAYVIDALQSRDGNILAFSDTNKHVWVATQRGFSQVSHIPFALAPNGTWVAGLDRSGNTLIVNQFADNERKEKRLSISKYMPRSYWANEIIVNEAGPGIVFRSTVKQSPLYLIYELENDRFLPLQASVQTDEEEFRVTPRVESKDDKICRVFSTKALVLTQRQGEFRREIQLSTVEGNVIATLTEDALPAYSDFVARFIRLP